MNPDIEFFLEEAFASLPPTSNAIGRVVVEPDYESAPAPGDPQQLRSEFTELLRGQNINDSALKSQDGLEIKIPNNYQLLSKYIRRITLHADSVEGDWVEVAPPGYWI
jgi:hypothetical protein